MNLFLYMNYVYTIVAENKNLPHHQSNNQQQNHHWLDLHNNQILFYVLNKHDVLELLVIRPTRNNLHLLIPVLIKLRNFLKNVKKCMFHYYLTMELVELYYSNLFRTAFYPIHRNAYNMQFSEYLHQHNCPV